MAQTTVPDGVGNGASQRPKHAFVRPLALYLFALILVILIPSLIVALVLINRTNDAQEDVVQALTNATVQAIGQTVDREVSGMVTTLRVLSTTSALDAGNLAELHRRGEMALIGTGAHLIAVDADLRQLLNTRVPFGQTDGQTSDPETAAKAVTRKLPTISGVFFGRTAQTTVFNVWLPIENNPAVRLLALTQNTQDLLPALQSRQLPGGWHAALVDARNNVIVATADTGLEPNTNLSLRQGIDLPSGEWVSEELNGEKVVTSEWRSNLTGWRVVAWAEADRIQKPLGDSILQLGAWGIAIALVAALVATLIATRIGESVQGLRLDAARLGRGEMIYPRTYPVTEIAEISKALAEASEQRKTAERDNRFLMRELAHRSKNQMAVINAMAKQTARGATDVRSYVAALEKRIMGLARSTDLLLANGRAGVMLRDLVELQLAPFLPGVNENRARVEGPDLRINPQGAQILGMALHELATNATRHGAFSVSDGTLALTWHVQGDELVLNWRESVAGPLVIETGRTGFGTIVLRTMVGGALGAQVQREAHPDGVEWTFHVPLSALDPAFAAERPDEKP
ncbi:sensor histidine kinase [Devosia rhizoryzae]|uniref:histidine kinase n=1 Tax=Devosia rhizoryzae TaxID=2774137 RepID=A0ABX7C421_9HYPH|nr:sensor histidine kinase [Devosia rhizoryzae]QQR38975.1 sensor histidine kinase [Devosia rhizoryzae]